MSGQTYELRISIPTARELAQRAAARSLAGQGSASAEGFDAAAHVGAHAPADSRRLRVETLRLIVAALGDIGTPIAGSARPHGTAGASMTVAIDGARVPLEVESDAGSPGTACLRLHFAAVQGLTCTQERHIAERVAASLADGRLRPTAPTSAAPDDEDDGEDGTTREQAR